MKINQQLIPGPLPQNFFCAGNSPVKPFKSLHESACLQRAVLFFLPLVLILFLFSAAANAQETLSSDEILIKVLHTNDTHAHADSHVVSYNNETEEVGGLARLTHFVKSVRQKDKNVLLLSAGDVFQGTMFFNFFKGIADFECMNLAGYDAMCLGNHEFDEGPQWLLESLKKADFEIVNCNVIFGKSYKDDAKKIKPYFIREINGLKIAVIGVLTKELFTLVNVKNLKDIKVNDPIEAITPIVKKLRPEVDMILILSHMGLKEDLELSELVPGIDLIVGGHSHSMLVSPVVMRTSKGKQVVINQAFEKGEYIGEVNMAYSKAYKKWRLVDGRLNRMDKTVPEDPQVKKIIAGYNEKIIKEVRIVIAETLTPLIGDKDSIRAHETNLGNLIADAILLHSKADMALINGGGVRTGLPAGKITIEDCIKIFPFSNTVTKLTIKGSTLREAFSMVAKARMKGTCGCFLHVSKGVKVRYHEGAVAELSLNGLPINDNNLYTVAMSDFTAAGGDGFSMFSPVPERFSDGIRINDILVDYVKSLKTINTETEGRILQ
jgi:5'-nucleotidase